MVMDLLGPSIDKLHEDMGREFSVRTVLRLAVQMIETIEFVHS